MKKPTSYQQNVRDLTIENLTHLLQDAWDESEGSAHYLGKALELLDKASLYGLAIKLKG